MANNQFVQSARLINSARLSAPTNAATPQSGYLGRYPLWTPGAYPMTWALENKVMAGASGQSLTALSQRDRNPSSNGRGCHGIQRGQHGGLAGRR
jgi:hypothetical protein